MPPNLLVTTCMQLTTCMQPGSTIWILKILTGPTQCLALLTVLPDGYTNTPVRVLEVVPASTIRAQTGRPTVSNMPAHIGTLVLQHSMQQARDYRRRACYAF